MYYLFLNAILNISSLEKRHTLAGTLKSVPLVFWGTESVVPKGVRFSEEGKEQEDREANREQPSTEHEKAG
jgi:hypothetical protein